MPRPKTKTPPPLQSFHVGDTLFEVRDETCWGVGRGMHRNLKKRQRADQAIEVIRKDYFTEEGNRKAKPDGKEDYMRNASSFAIEMQLQGLGEDEGADDSSIRKKTYAEAKEWLDAVDAAMGNNR